MNESPPNLLNALFALFPSDTPENFLSEAFAHVLSASPKALEKWTSKVLGFPVSGADLQVRTRVSEVSERGSHVYPDMLIEGKLSDGTQVAILFEHKWKADFNEQQIDDYAKTVEKKKLSGIKAHLAFIGSNKKQFNDARRSKHLGADKVYLWENVYIALFSVPSPDQNITQFLDFMKTQGLNPGEPIQQATMIAFLQSAGFLKQLDRYAHKLLKEEGFIWDPIPLRFRRDPHVKDRWGRIAIEFVTENWQPAITLGFLYDTSDHHVDFVDKARGIDLFLRVEAAPANQGNIEPTRNVLHAKKKLFNQGGNVSRILGDPGKQNPHTLFIVQTCLADIIAGAHDETEQLDAIYTKLHGWIGLLFSDGSLDQAFKKSFNDNQ